MSFYNQNCTGTGSPYFGQPASNPGGFANPYEDACARVLAQLSYSGIQGHPVGLPSLTGISAPAQLQDLSCIPQQPMPPPTYFSGLDVEPVPVPGNFTPFPNCSFQPPGLVPFCCPPMPIYTGVYAQPSSYFAPPFYQPSFYPAPAHLNSTGISLFQSSSGTSLQPSWTNISGQWSSSANAMLAEPTPSPSMYTFTSHDLMGFSNFPDRSSSSSSHSAGSWSRSTPETLGSSSSYSEIAVDGESSSSGHSEMDFPANPINPGLSFAISDAELIENSITPYSQSFQHRYPWNHDEFLFTLDTKMSLRERLDWDMIVVTYFSVPEAFDGKWIFGMMKEVDEPLIVTATFRRENAPITAEFSVRLDVVSNQQVVWSVALAYGIRTTRRGVAYQKKMVHGHLQDDFDLPLVPADIYTYNFQWELKHEFMRRWILNRVGEKPHGLFYFNINGEAP